MLKILLGLIFCLFILEWGDLVFLMGVFIFFILTRRYEGFNLENSFVFELDLLCFSLVLLRLWLVILCILARVRFIGEVNSSLFSVLFVALIIFLFLRFSLNSFILFFIRFECCLIPVLVLILGWGYQPERSDAGYYLIIYTLFASLPLLILIFYLKIDFRRILIIIFYGGKLEGVFYYFLIIAFLVKFPMYRVHLWLPKAHVEAPVRGSIILAGILLKLGGYGIIRFMVLIKYPFFIGQNFLISLSLWGGFVVRLICIYQFDIKLLVALSSVVHIRTCIRGIVMMSDFGIKGAFLIIISHGLTSSGLFYLVGIIYGRRGRRSILINKGLINLMPRISLWWFLLLRRNISAPPTLNLLSEIFLISSILRWRWANFIPLGFIVFFRAGYRLYMYSLTQHGKYNFSKQGFHRGFILEYLINFLHWFPLNLLILFRIFLICFFSLIKILFCGDKDGSYPENIEVRIGSF